MWSRGELVRMLVLGHICDDYEEIVHITENIDEDGSILGMIIERPEVEHALHEIVATGLAKVYDLASNGEVKELSGVPAELHRYDPYFMATPEGCQLHLANFHLRPLDEVGELRGGWTPPEN